MLYIIFFHLGLFLLYGLSLNWPQYILYYPYGSNTTNLNTTTLVNLSPEYLSRIYLNIQNSSSFFGSKTTVDSLQDLDMSIMGFYMDNLGFYNERFQWLYLNWIHGTDSLTYSMLFEELCYFNDIFN